MSIAETATESNVPQKAPFHVKTESRVLEVAPAPAGAALEHFSRKLEFETDCADVFASFVSQRVDFVLVDVRSEKLFLGSHVPGAISVVTKAPVMTLCPALSIWSWLASDALSAARETKGSSAT